MVKGIFFSIWLGLFFLEIFLMLSRRFDTYTEKSKQGYQSSYKPLSSFYNTESKEFTITRPEYSYTYPLNSLGFPDREWKKNGEADSCKRILALGDSFTHGDGDAYGGSYVFRLGRLLNGSEKMDSPYYMMNGGFCGSDPFFNYVNLRDRLLVYSPDIIIQMISSHDVLDDYAKRGGMERFLPVKKLKYRKGPWWEPLWAMSHIVRAIVGTAALNKKVDLKEAQHAIKNLFSDYVKLSQQKGMRLIVVIRPDLHELNDGKYDYDFSDLSDYLKAQQNVCVVDLMPYYAAYIKNTRTSAEDYFWKQDAHHNAKGYQMMAEGIYTSLKPILKTDSVSTSN